MFKKNVVFGEIILEAGSMEKKAELLGL